MKYYPIHTHLHCSHEATASIASHMSWAKSLGIAYLWLTEHDTRMGTKKSDIPLFTFPTPELFTRLPNGVKAGFEEAQDNNGAYSFTKSGDGYALHLSAKQTQRESLLFHSKGKKHSNPLFAQLTITLSADVCVEEKGTLCVEFILSAQPPSYQQACLRYAIGTPSNEADAPVQTLPFPEKRDGAYHFPISTDVSEAIGGLDNALCNVRISLENGASMTVRALGFSHELNFEAVRQEQVKLAQKRGKQWQITPFVGFEITGAGNHKNCFSTKTPVIDYREFSYAVSNECAIEHLRKHDAIFSWNHPFTRTLKLDQTNEERFEWLASDLIQNNVYGATLMEVGFPMGRDTFCAQDYLRLWDRLSENGIFITGNGDSDNHHAVKDGWTEGNNFCTYAGLDDTPSEEAFVKAFRRGSVWMGNPVYMGSVSLQANGKPMGSVLLGSQTNCVFAVQDVKCNGFVVCVVNGQEAKRYPLRSGRADGEIPLTAQQKYNFARLEIYREDGLLIAASNPIYLIDRTEAIRPEWQDRL